MNLSFLVIINLLILYFIYRQQKRNCLECKQTITLFLAFIIILYEIYMDLGYKKKKSPSI